jgi:hypothetical protein
VRSSHSPDQITVSFDDDHAVADAGLILAATLAEGLMLGELVNEHVDLGSASGAANAGDKAMTLVHSALAGGEWIGDADRLRAGATGQVLGHRVAAPSTLGTFLRSFTWGSARQLDQVAGQALARAWQAGAGPGPWPLTIDIDSTHCQTYGLHKQGATGVDRHGERGYHPLLATVAGTGDVLGSRLREGVANTGRGAASFVTETINRARRVAPAGRSACAPTRGSTTTRSSTPATSNRWPARSPSSSPRRSTRSSPRSPPTPGRRSPIGWRAAPTSPRPATGRSAARAGACA